MEEFRHPFVPPKEDLELEGKTGEEITWSVYSTCCRQFGPEEKNAADRKIREIILRAGQKAQRNTVPDDG